MTMAHVLQAIFDEICTWKRWHSGAAANQALWSELRRTGHDRGEDGSSFDVARAIDEVGHQAITKLAKAGKIQCSGKPGSLGILYAPLHVPRTAEGGPDEPKPLRRPAAKKGKVQPNTATQPAPKATPRALGDLIEETLLDWNFWFIEEQLRAKVMEAMPLDAQPSELGWEKTLSEMLGQGRIERCEENGHTLYRVPPLPPLPAQKVGPSVRGVRHGHERQATPSRQLDFLDILLARLPIHLERVAMTLRLYTGRIGYLGEDGLPVTRRRVTHPAGLPFAPSERLLLWGLAERRAGRWDAAWPAYAARYTEEMRVSYRQHRAAWDALLAREEVTVLCFCHGPDRCHRGVLAGLLVRCGAVYEGER